jgi:GGDEF domain-containing protein
MKNISPNDALQLLDIHPQPVLLLENTGAIRAVNQAFRTLVSEQAVNNADMLLDPALLAPLLGTSTVVNWIMPSGDERWLAIEVIDLPDIQARFYTDITEKLRLRHERDALQKELGEQTLYDLRNSSLLSRRGILISLAPLVARARRYNSPLSLVTISINTAEDHQAEARSDMTALLRDQTRWADLVGCHTDDTFILVLQETTRDAALLLVEKLAAQVERMNTNESQPLTACYGITECQKQDNAESILERAEQALQEAGNNETGRSIAL